MPLQAAVGLVLAEHGLAEQVEVEAVARLAQASRWRGRASSGVASSTRWPTMRRSTRRAIGMTSHGNTGATTPPRRIAAAEVPGQELRRELRDLLEVAARDAEVFGAHDAVDEADGEGEPVRVLQHAGEALGGGFGGVVGALGEPAAHEGDDVIGVRPRSVAAFDMVTRVRVLHFGHAVLCRAIPVCDATSVRYSE